MIPLPPIATLRPVGLAVAAAALVGSGWMLNGWRLSGHLEQQRAEVQRVKAEHAQAVAIAASTALAQSEAHRTTEAALRGKIEKAEDVRNKERTALVAARTAADRRTVGVLDQLAAVTCSAAASAPTADSSTATSGPTPTLRELVGPLLSEYRRAVEAAESHGADVRKLLNSWPKE